MQKNLADLHSVFVPFETVKFEGGTVIYMNECIDCELNRSQLLEKYSYIIPNNGGDNPPETEKKTFLAERYGGDGMLTNGGGARCGFDGRYQLKGLGANRLVGKRPPDARGNSHANGFLSLDIAIYESIWAEIVNIALPYGAVRTIAIIDLNIDFEESNAPHARALLVRVPAVRPAHFIRATYFKEEKSFELSPDAQRVKSAIHELIFHLPKTKNDQSYTDIKIQLQDGIVELARRFAVQFACAKAKRLFHASVSASNLTINGEWLDLAGAQIYSERCWWEGFNKNEFAQEHLPAISSLREICYYLHKYQVTTYESSNRISTLLVESFCHTYGEQLSLNNAAQVGFPIGVLQKLIHEPIFIEFSKYLSEILRLDNFSLTPISTTFGWKGYEHWMSKLYKQLLKHALSGTFQDYSWLTKDTILLNKLISAYKDLFELVFLDAKTKGVTRERLGTSIAINAIRLNRCDTLLIDLHSEIKSIRENKHLIRKHSTYEALFKKAKHAATLTFKVDEYYLLRLWETETTILYYDATTDLYTAKLKHDQSSISKPSSQITDHVSFFDEVVSFYNEAMELKP